MISRGIDIAAKGMMSLIDFQDSVANNIANVNTAGYKKEGLSFRNVYNALIEEPVERNNPKNHDGRLVGEISMGSVTNKLVHEFSQGTLSRTDNPLDLGIEGDGFFKLRAPDGSIMYTRNGSFVVDRGYWLKTKEGEYVLDVDNRRIRMIPEDFDPELFRDRIETIIGESGNIEINSYNQKIPLQTIGVFDFSNKEDLFEIGDAKFIPMDPENNPELRSEKFTVQQGMLELSNSNVIKEMINTIATSRNYESLTKVVTTNSDMLATAVAVGRIGS